MSDKHSAKQSKPSVERVKAEGIWCLVVRDEDGTRAFLDHCSHKDIPLGPKAKIKKGCLRCPHHNVCFDTENGAVVDANGKKVPDGLVSVPIAVGPDGKPVLAISPEHHAYLWTRCKNKKRKKPTEKDPRTWERRAE